MFKIKVERTVNADINCVFDAISDHGAYDLFPMIDRSSLLTEGVEEKNGKGAYRHVQMGRFQVWEHITEFERPSHMQYKIEKAKPLPMTHTKGCISLVKTGEQQTHVTWISEGYSPLPLVGGLLDKMTEKNGARIFHSMLKSIERR